MKVYGMRFHLKYFQGNISFNLVVSLNKGKVLFYDAGFCLASLLFSIEAKKYFMNIFS